MSLFSPVVPWQSHITPTKRRPYHEYIEFRNPNNIERFVLSDTVQRIENVDFLIPKWKMSKFVLVSALLTATIGSSAWQWRAANIRVTAPLIASRSIRPSPPLLSECGRISDKWDDLERRLDTRNGFKVRYWIFRAQSGICNQQWFLIWVLNIVSGFQCQVCY